MSFLEKLGLKNKNETAVKEAPSSKWDSTEAEELAASKELRANMAAKAAARTEAEAAAKGKDQQAADDLSAEIKARLNQN